MDGRGNLSGLLDYIVQERCRWSRLHFFVTSGQEIFQIHVRPWHDDVPFISNFKYRKIRNDLLVAGQA
jgi:hypothetical protein